MYVFVAIVMIFVPMIACDYPENFKHNVAKEFSADDIFENKAKIRHRLAKKMKNMGALFNTTGGQKGANDNSKIELMANTSKPTEVVEDLTNPEGKKTAEDEW